MRLSTIVLAALPALALAQEDDTSTTTMIATTTLTKTYTLSEVHTIIHTPSHNSSATYTPTASYTMTTETEASSTSGSDAEPTTVDEDDAASLLGAGRVLLTGMVGMAVVALM
ncbi:hypothetical protein LIA77_10532 [Sarocladium implicatum]|nr:hypothetical protein LIA77_10532 [Sarocladium implicatum]